MVFSVADRVAWWGRRETRVTKAWGLRLSIASSLLVALGLAGCNDAEQDRSAIERVMARQARRAHAAREELLTERVLYSEHKEEVIIRHFFADWRGGFFVDVGCARPRSGSNTYYIEDRLGWSGIAVDALGEYAPLWRELRPRSKFFNFLVSDRSDDVMPFYRSELPGISSYLKGRADWHSSGSRPVKVEKIQVPTVTLTKLLNANGVSRIDFLSMDIEGAEPLALAGFDIDRFLPALVCIEVKPSTRGAIESYFSSHGYVRLDAYDAYDVVNRYYAPKDEGRRADKCRRCPTPTAAASPLGAAFSPN